MLLSLRFQGIQVLIRLLGLSNDALWLESIQTLLHFEISVLISVQF